MWLNDAYDSAFDARFRPERPIPAGVVRRQTVLRAGIGAVLLGWCCLLPLGAATALWTVALTGCIELYDRTHKRFAPCEWLMAGCRFLLYPLAASVGAGGIVWPAVAAGAVLAVYVAGITYLARVESLPDERVPRWPWLLLCAPLVWHLCSRRDMTLAALGGWLLIWPFAFWLWRAWRQTAWRRTGQTRRPPPVADLLAGIVLVDLLLTPWPTPGRVLAFCRLVRRGTVVPTRHPRDLAHEPRCRHQCRRPDQRACWASIRRPSGPSRSAGSKASIQPAFPAVTCTAQSTYLTGQNPAQHGIVGNGWYDRALAEIQFWKQSNHLVTARKLWEDLRDDDRRHVHLRAAFLVVQHVCGGRLFTDPAPDLPGGRRQDFRHLWRAGHHLRGRETLVGRFPVPHVLGAEGGDRLHRAGSPMRRAGSRNGTGRG